MSIKVEIIKQQNISMNSTGIGIIIGSVILVTMMTVLSNQRQHEAQQSAEKYEQCVQREYHTTPWAWNAEHGEYPECAN